MKIYTKSLKLMVFLTIILSTSCSDKIGNFTYEPITSTSFTENDIQYSFQYLVSNNYLGKKKPLLFKNRNQSLTKYFYWFENDKLFQTQGNFSGKLLHGNYIEKYSSGQIKIKGKMEYGLKDKLWLSYFDTGKIERAETWDKGILKTCKTYNDAQQLTSDVFFRNSKKNGWEYKYDSLALVSRVKFKNGSMKTFRHLNEL